MSRQAKTQAQHKRIFALGAKRGFGVEELRELCESEFGNESISALTFDQANHLIVKLGGYAIPMRPVYKPKRTEQDHRQKAGVPQLVSATHIDHLNKLWRAIDGRTPEGLIALTRKILKHDKPRTTAECSKVIEAVKSMNRRHAQKEAA